MINNNKFKKIKVKSRKLPRSLIAEACRRADVILPGWKYIYADEDGWLFASTHKRIGVYKDSVNSSKIYEHNFEEDERDLVTKSLGLGFFISEFQVKKK